MLAAYSIKVVNLDYILSALYPVLLICKKSK